MKVKICGITSAEDIKIVNACKPDFAGFVMFFPKSKRNISPETAKSLIETLDKNVLSVAVTVSPTLEQVKTAYDCGFDYIQIHGEVEEDVLSNPYLKVIRAFNVSDLEKFDEYRMNQNIVGYVFDAHEPGSGKTFDWTMLENLPRDDKLFMLAGGLNPETVAKAVKAVKPDGVDVSSGVENSNGNGKDFEKVKKWYDGYLLDGYQVYNPKAVVSLMTKGKFRSYWSETGSYEVVVPLICMNFDGLKTAIIEMLSGAEVEVNTASFKNDPAKIQNRDDVITYLIHLGYLGYNEENGTAFVPNEEIRQELSTAVRNSHWNEMITFQQESRKLLMATLTKDEKCVAQEIEKIHNDYVSIIQYNNENSLSSVLAIAYLGSMQYYFKPIREMPTGYGFADLIFVPKPEYVNSYPAMVMELKWNKDAQTAVKQIKEKKYPESLLQYTGDILLVGINYDPDSKKHECLIEKYEKT